MKFMEFSKDCIDIKEHREERAGKSRIEMREGKEPTQQRNFSRYRKTL